MRADDEEQEDRKRRRLRLELEDLEYSLKGLNERLDRLRVEQWQKAVAARAQLLPELERYKQQQLELANNKKQHESLHHQLECSVHTLRSRLERWRNTDDQVTEVELELLEEINWEDSVATERIEQAVMNVAVTAAVDPPPNTAIDDTNSNNRSKAIVFDELTEIQPWPTREILEKSWSKLSDRFLLHFRHAQRITQFLYMSWREVLSCPEVANHNNSDEALFRRQGLWRTSLDVRLLLGSLEDYPKTALVSPGITTTRNILLNPDISMCP
jgi:hypothetical protein